MCMYISVFVLWMCLHTCIYGHVTNKSVLRNSFHEDEVIFLNKLLGKHQAWFLV